MKSSKSGCSVGESDDSALKSFQTGMFVRSNKSQLLINVVKKLLHSRFSCVVECGPHLENDMCEILLRPTRPTGASIAAAKALLEQYFHMINETEPTFTFKKQIEIINLEDEVIDLVNPPVSGSCGLHGETSDHKGNSTRTVRIDPENQLVIDLLNETQTSDDQESAYDKDSSLNNNKLKRKYALEDDDDVVEVLDDDVIVLNDSFTIKNSFLSNQKQTSNHNCVQSSSNVELVAFDDGIRNVCESASKEVIDLDTTSNNNSTIHGSPQLSYDLNNSGSSDIVCLNIVKGSKIVTNNKHFTANTKTNPSLSSPPKKASKLSYKRPPHLIQPLITNPTTNLMKTKSSELSNIYNPNAEADRENRTGLRPIIIDGNNVGVSHGQGEFSLRGIQICINYFEKRGHKKIKAFIPHYRKNKVTFHALNLMERKGTVVITPSRKVEGKLVASYDDRYIVQYASEFGGVIISTDNYRDLLKENSDWKETIEKRLLMFTWVDDLLIFPQDPLGRRGPNLDEFLKFPD